MFRISLLLLPVLTLGFGAVLVVSSPLAHAQTPASSTAFLKAVADGDGDTVTQMLTVAGPGLIDSRGGDREETALHIVARRGDSTWISFLLGKGARPDVLDKDGNSPLMIAILNDDSETARVLLVKGASADFINTRGETALIRAVQLRKPMLVRLLVAHGADADRADYVAGRSARDYATRDARSIALLDALRPRTETVDDDFSMGPFLTPGD